ncbi:30S ribosomal protein S4 [Candidatus Pacearchaeota archaeon]|nr:MAG: 30S ribosomal protein S4 [Candidatus Pacearchaeota archaeon]
MGDIKRKRNTFNKPRQIFDRVRIEEENEIVKNYGLKNKREVWKAKSIVSRFRRRAKELIQKSVEEQKQFFERLGKLGIPVNSISDVLALTEKDVLERRLQTVVFKKGFAPTPRGARQLIVHKKVLVGEGVVNIPSFWVTRDLEDKISVKPVKLKEKKVEAAVNG